MGKEIKTSFINAKGGSMWDKTERWNYLEKGDKVRLITDEECFELFGIGIQKMINYIWNGHSIKSYLSERGEIKIIPQILSRIKLAKQENSNVLFPNYEGCRLEIPLTLLSIVGKQNVIKHEDESEKEEPNENLSLRVKNKEPKIIEEMINKVDRKLFKTILTTGIRTQRDYDGYLDIEKEEVVDNYLRDWANAKYEFYLLFGRNLSINVSKEIILADDEIARRFVKFIGENEVYEPILSLIESKDVINNVCGDNALLEYYTNGVYKKGMKLSKFLSKYLQDTKLDIEFSKVLQSRKENSVINISINPIDYLMESTNKHDWKSCHNLIDGCFKPASFSLMLDDSTLIAYADNGRQDYHYDILGLEFDYKSFKCREAIHIDKDTSSVGFNKYYPQMTEEMKQTIRNMIEDTLSNYLGVSNVWKLNMLRPESYAVHNGDFHYKDPIQANIVHESMSNSPEIKYSTGAEFVYDLITGKKLSTENKITMYGESSTYVIAEKDEFSKAMNKLKKMRYGDKTTL